VTEFKTMVKALHAAGIEVILDVVFNHTAEGNEAGPVLNLKGIDNAAYYRLLPDKIHYDNVTGCGNTVNCDHPQVRTLIVDCLRYWTETCTSTVFASIWPPYWRATTAVSTSIRPFSARCARIPSFNTPSSSPSPGTWVGAVINWAGFRRVGPSGTIVIGTPCGRFGDATPAGSASWRSASRARAISSGITAANPPPTSISLPRTTASRVHDLVSYNDRHNEANLENNADGTGNNLSWNCGVEGPTADPNVLALRKRQIRNLLATLVLSQGVPMLQAGDEFLRTQRGNNNAYCQDNEISWIDWRLREAHADLVSFVRLLMKTRAEHPEFRRETFLKGVASRSGVKDVSWLHMRGGEMTHNDWHDGGLRTLGILLGNRNNTVHRLLLMLNAGAEDLSFNVPPPAPGSPWVCRFDTGREHAAVRAIEFTQHYPLMASSAVLLEC
jgi:isoamylase